MKYWIVILILLFRVPSLFNLILDDDEAWFAVTGSAITRPKDVFISAIDNKPPGMTWYYWIISQFTATQNTIQIARLIQFVFIIFSALLIQKLSEKMNKEPSKEVKHRDFSPLVLYLLLLGAMGPKIYAVTNEGLMNPLIILALYWIWPNGPNQKDSYKIDKTDGFKSFLSGMALAFAVLIKQTGILFILPWLFAFNHLFKLSMGLAGFLSILAMGTSLVGASSFWYWVYVYPSTVLTNAREQIFSEFKFFLINFLLFGFFIFPIIPYIPKCLILSWKNRNKKTAQVLMAWLLSSLTAVLIGKALFLHYFLLIFPPLCLLLMHLDSQMLKKTFARIWLGSTYALSACLAGIPIVAFLWGIDLEYFNRVSQRMTSLVPKNGKVFVWGGNVIPLALSGHPSLTGFPNSRFAAPPYSTSETQKLFLNTIQSEKPDLILDLHERGDNRFNLPITILPKLWDLMRNDYTAWNDPTLPWVTFYVLRKREFETPLHQSGFCSPSLLNSQDQASDQSYHSYPKSIHLTLKLLAQSLNSTQNFINTLKNWSLWNRFLRSAFANEWLNTACGSTIELPTWQFLSLQDFPTHDSTHEMIRFSEKVEIQFHQSQFNSSWVLDAPFWWSSLAIVELQPAMLPRNWHQQKH
jgi:4-amino-4-deoxy-L-arabinose transferase-like glycosyltransferase